MPIELDPKTLLRSVAKAPGSLSGLPELINPSGRNHAADFDALDDRVPLLLLPVRLETRFFNRARTLKVRIYPDQIHLDDHAGLMTAEEQTIGRRYWRSWHAAKDDAGRQAARDWLVTKIELRRAAWVARQTRPKVGARRKLLFPKRKLQAEGRRARAACLPERWAVIGYVRVKGRLVQRFVEWGRPIPEDLALSFDAEDQTPWSGDAKALPVDASLAWMVDYTRAEAQGMAVTVDLSAMKDARLGIALLLVTGVSKASPAEGAKQIASLLTAHNYGEGLAFLPQGTPTNNTDAVDSGWSSRADADAVLARELDGAELAKDPKSEAKRLAAALGIPGNRVLPRVENGARNEEAPAAAMNRVLWPVTWGQYFDDLLKNKRGVGAVPRPAINYARRWFIDHVRGGAPLPSLRIGNQPYGVVPIQLSESPKVWTDATAWLTETLLFMRDKWIESVPAVPRMDPVRGATAGSSANDPESVLVEVLASLPHPSRFLVRGLRDRREDYPADPGLSLLALFGLVWLAADDPTYGHDALSILGRWGWAIGVLSGDEFLNIDRAQVRAVDNPALGGAAKQLAALKRFEAKLPKLVGAHEISGARAWVRSMRAAIKDHAARQAPLSEMSSAPLKFKGVLSGRVDDPKLFYAVYDDDEDTRSWNRPLVEVANAQEGEQAATYLRALAQRILVVGGAKAVSGSKLAGSKLPGSTLSGSKLLQAQPSSLRHTTLTGVRSPLLSPSQPLAGQAAPKQPGKVDDGLSEALRANAPLLYQLVDAALDGGTIRGDQAYRAALSALANQEPEALELRMRETLGLASHRLDAWLTSLARARLDAMRAKRARGLQLAGYGWVLDLKPQVTGTGESQGFVHAPSLQQATTAAILRAGWSAYGTEAADSTLAVDLRGARVREAAWLLDGIRQGQDLGELLGARFERRLHDARLDDWIDPCRRVVLASQSERKGEAGQPVGVVDGLALAELHAKGGLEAVLVAAAKQGDRRALTAALTDILAVMDAIGDAGIAESVHQVAQGNLTRAAATLDAISLGEVPPPELGVLRTPLASTGVTHRVLVTLGSSTPVSGSPRATLEPMLESWARHLLGFGGHAVFHYVVVDAEGTRSEAVAMTLSQVYASALDAVFEAPSGELGPGARWQRRIEAKLRDAETGAAELGARVELDPAPADLEVGQITLADFAELARTLRLVLARARPLDGRDLLAPDVEAVSGRRLAEVEKRVKTLITGFDAARDKLDLSLPPPDEDDPRPVGDATLAALRRAMLGLAGYAFPVAVPSVGWHEDQREALHDEAWSLFLAVGGRRQQLADAQLQWDEADASQAPSEDTRLRRARLAVALLLGKDSPLLPRFAPAVDALAPFARSAKLLEEDPSKVYAWLQTLAKVRPELGRFDELCGLLELIEDETRLPLEVAQLPELDEAWVGTAAPTADTGGRLALAAVDHGAAASLANKRPIAGLVIDEWVEQIPRSTQTTGLAFHFDAPASRAPQAALLAVPPAGASWDFDLVTATLRRCLEDAQLRAVGPESLAAYGHHLPAIFSPTRLDAGPQPESEEQS